MIVDERGEQVKCYLLWVSYFHPKLTECDHIADAIGRAEQLYETGEGAPCGVTVGGDLVRWLDEMSGEWRQPMDTDYIAARKCGFRISQRGAAA